jgi:acetyltransferase-like isoleucine patch superfamily enzyme
MKSPLITGLLTAVTYVFYSLVLGISFFPSLFLGFKAWTLSAPHDSVLSIFLLALAAGGAFVLFFVSGVLVFGVFIRIFSLGIKPGTYAIASLTMFRWLLYSGLYNVIGHLILQLIPMSFLQKLFFRIIGAKLGKNVQINTWFLNDAYLLEIGDNVIIGGKTDISCHTFEGGKLVLKGIRIGSGTAIGQGCYISPGVTIGERCVIGQYSLVRKNTDIPARSIISAIAGLPIRAVTRIERGEESPA